MATEFKLQPVESQSALSPIPHYLSRAVRSPRPTITVVIPALNEADNLPHVIPFIPEWVDEVILVDGHSTDNTVDVARALLSSIRVVTQDAPGKGSALRTGFASATGDILVMLDADGSMNPEEVHLYVGALLGGADFVKGSRFLQGGGTSDMPLYRRLGNMGFVWLSRLLFGGRFSDLCYGYAAFWSDVGGDLELDGEGFEIETMMNLRALRCGFRIAEVPSFESRRIYGTGRLKTLPDGLRVLRTILHERFMRSRTSQWKSSRLRQRFAFAEEASKEAVTSA